MSSFKAGDVVMVEYGEGVRVGRYLLPHEAEILNEGEHPLSWGSSVRVSRPKGKVHYFGTCGGVDRLALARSIKATTCLHCLLSRAKQLRGWRWTHEHNRDEITWLKLKLGAKVDGFEEDVRDV